MTPPKGVFITGTDTGVGKTVVSAGIIRALLKRGTRVGAMKPIETGCKRADPKSQIQTGEFRPGELIPADGLFLKEMAGMDDPLDLVAPIRFEYPLAPLVASELEAKPVDLDTIFDAYDKLSAKYGFMAVEGAGGLLVPIKDRQASSVKRQASTDKGNNSLDARRLTLDASRYFMVDLMRALGLPLIVVTRPGLGTINHTLLTVEHAIHAGLKVSGIIINHAAPPGNDLAERTNPEILRRLCPVPLLGTFPYETQLSPQCIEDAALKGIDLDSLPV